MQATITCSILFMNIIGKHSTTNIQFLKRPDQYTNLYAFVLEYVIPCLFFNDLTFSKLPVIMNDKYGSILGIRKQNLKNTL